MVLKSTSTRGNGGIKTDRSDVHAGIEMVERKILSLVS